MQAIWNYYYNVTKKMLSLTGQWPYQTRGEKLPRMAFVTIVEISMLIPQVLYPIIDYLIVEKNIKKLFH